MNSKVIVVTGAAKGIGRAIAGTFHDRGWQVAVMDRQAAQGPWAYDYQGDVGDPGALEAFAQAVEKRFPQVDALVHNAMQTMGGYPRSGWEDYSSMCSPGMLIGATRALAGRISSRLKGWEWRLPTTLPPCWRRVSLRGPAW